MNTSHSGVAEAATELALRLKPFRWWYRSISPTQRDAFRAEFQHRLEILISHGGTLPVRILLETDDWRELNAPITQALIRAGLQPHLVELPRMTMTIHPNQVIFTEHAH